MYTVLHVTAGGLNWWEKSPEGWRACTGPGKEPVWVIADLAEESVSEIAVPRVFGTDRSHFVERQLATRYPDTEFRVALPPIGQTSLLDRLSPPFQTLLGVEPGEKIKVALQAFSGPMAGVWSVSVLLAQLAQRSHLPADLFVVHCQSGALRILYLKKRALVLTRLITGVLTASEQAAEVVRTMRHLENTRVLNRSTARISALVLGGEAMLVSSLAKDRVDALPQSKGWKGRSDADSLTPLFDRACKSPTGQLAPLSYRTAYVSRNLIRGAHFGTVFVLLVAVWLVFVNVRASFQSQAEKQQADLELTRIAGEVATLDKAIGIFGVSPDLVRNALAIDAREISGAPDFAADMQRLSQAITSVPGVRIKNLQWDVLNPTASACLAEGTLAPATDPTQSITTEPTPQRKVQLQMEVQFPDPLGPSQRMQKAENLTRALGALQGVAILRDPARMLRDGGIQVGGTYANDGANLLWCATLASPSTLNSSTGAKP